MKLIVGLGNPGEKYINTRHNLGFVIVEHFLKDFQSAKNTVWENSSKFKSEIAQIEWQPRHGELEKVILAKPQTYMNNSGMAVSLISQYLNISISDIWVLHDDIDLPLGSMKIRFGGGSAGHHGINSIIEKLGADKFWRFRMGTGGENDRWKTADGKLKNVEEFVLSGFTGAEKGKVKHLIKRGVKAVEASLEDSLEKAMNRFNTK